MQKVLFLLTLMLIAFSSCVSEQSDDLVQTPNRNNSIEVKIEVIHQGNLDILKTTKDVWVKNTLKHSYVNFDTMPSLGDTVTMVQDEKGDDKYVRLPKDYEIYITVK